MKAMRLLTIIGVASMLLGSVLTLTPAAPSTSPSAAFRAGHKQIIEPNEALSAIPSCDGWSETMPYPIQIYANAVASVGNYLYSFGGETNGAITNAAHRFDGSAWQPIASLPYSSSHASAVSDGTYVYIVGGNNPGTGDRPMLYRYNPSSDNYTQLAPPIYPTSGQAAVYLNGKVYRIGGEIANGYPPQAEYSVEVYDIASDTWSTATNYPHYFLSGAAMALNGYLYTAGSGTWAYRYDPTSHIWDDAAIADPPGVFNNSTGGLVNGKLLLVDGESDNAYTWDPSSNSWSLAASPLQPVSYAGGATLSGSFYLVGGLGSGTPSVVQRHTNNCPPATATPTATGTPPTATPSPTPACEVWQQQPAYPYPIVGSATTTMGNYIYSFGGESGINVDGIFTDAFKYDGNTWTRIADVPTEVEYTYAATDGTYIYLVSSYNGGRIPALYRYAPATNSYTALAPPITYTLLSAAVYLNGKVYEIGGFTASNHYTSTVQVYNIGTNSWSLAANYPIPIDSAMAMTLNGYIYVAGGNNGQPFSPGKTYRYDPASNTWEDPVIADLPQDFYPEASALLSGQWVMNFAGRTEIWHPATNSWSAGAAMPLRRSFPATSSLNGAYYAVGGEDPGTGNTYMNDNQRYTNTCPPPTPQPTSTLCATPFVDIGGNVFYGSIAYLYCSGAVSGTDATHYSPSATSTRGQFARVVIKGFGLPITTPASQSFTDVPPGYFAYNYIESGLAYGILSGYAADQCVAAGATFPCYLPNRAITRAELTKLVVKAAGYARITPSGEPSFVDVPPSYFAYSYIETGYAHGIIRGTDATHFQPGRNIRRDEMAQVVYKGMITP